MTSQYRLQIITIHILPNISRSKGNQKSKFGLFIKYNGEIFCSKNHAENEKARLVLKLYLVFKKVLCKG